MNVEIKISEFTEQQRKDDEEELKELKRQE